MHVSISSDSKFDIFEVYHTNRVDTDIGEFLFLIFRVVIPPTYSLPGYSFGFFPLRAFLTSEYSCGSHSADHIIQPHSGLVL